VKLNMGVVVGGPAIAAVVIAGGLAWVTNLVARTMEREMGIEQEAVERHHGGPAGRSPEERA
jgi:hypothetical protein